jgi:hypothetical protein
MTADTLCEVAACRVVAFMFHDRVAFGGVLIAIAVLYLWLVEFPLREGAAWAWWTLLLSGGAGFLTFLAYLGYGYLDTWHGVGTLALLPCFVVGLARVYPRLSSPRRPGVLLVRGEAPRWWSRAGAGRALLLATAAGMVTGGATILMVGMTRVFVVQDLAFMGVGREELEVLNSRLIPLIAHDRAGFGGGLMSCGMIVGLCGWCAPSSRSLWQALAASGTAGFGCAIGVHVAVGYVDAIHLAPAIAGALLFTGAVVVLYGVMVAAGRPGRSMRVGRAAAGALVASMLSTACAEEPTDPDGDSRYAPTEARLLSVGSPTKDEDASVLRARDGRMFVTWFSDRGANPDIYLTSTERGTEWTEPVRVTVHAGGDFYPNLAQDEQGTFHLVWFRWTAPFRGHIWYNTSADGVTWDQSREVQVTTGVDADDWVPVLSIAPDGTMLIVFASYARAGPGATSDLYVLTKRSSDSSWGPPVRVMAISSDTEHDNLPFIAWTGDRFDLIWSRHDTTEPLPWVNPRSKLYHSTSLDGATWSPATPITNEAGNVVNLFGEIHRRFDGEWSVAWLSTRSGPPKVQELALASLSAYPAGLRENTQLGDGYSHRIAPTATEGVYLGVWVAGPDGAQDIRYRFFR